MERHASAHAPDGRDWRPLAAGVRTPSRHLSPDAPPPGVEPTTRVVPSDGLRAAAVAVPVIVSAAPRVVATQPADGGVASPGTAITVWTLAELAGTAPDAIVLEREHPPEGACRLALTSPATPDEVRSFVERAILANRLFLTANRSEGDIVRIGARGSAFDAEAVIESGPPTRLVWVLEPAGR